MYTHLPEYRVVRDTELSVPPLTVGDDEMFFTHSSHQTDITTEVVWKGSRQPSNIEIGAIMAHIQMQGSPRKTIPNSSVLRDEVKTQTRRTIRTLGWRTIHTTQIDWVPQASLTKR
jgi:hypothetical protein